MSFVNVEIKKIPYNDTEHRYHMRLHASGCEPRNPDTGELYTMADLPFGNTHLRCELCTDPGTDDVELLKQLFRRGEEYLNRLRKVLDGTEEPASSACVDFCSHTTAKGKASPFRERLV